MIDRQNKLWEGSRMFLSEHRTALIQYYRSKKEIKPPSLDDQRMEQIHHTLEEALLTKKEVMIQYITKYDFKEYEGEITRVNPILKKIYVKNEHGEKHILFDQLMDIQLK